MAGAKKKKAVRKKRPSTRGTGESSMQRRGRDGRMAVYPGSFDPITNGHVDIIRRACNAFSRVTVAVAYNPNKDAAMFTREERIQMIYDAVPDLADQVDVDSFSGLLVDYAKKVDAAVIVRGLRAVSDFEYEFQMTMMNRHLRPDVETVFLMADEQHFYTSSRLVKEVASFGGDVSSFVPEPLMERFQKRLKRPRKN